MNSTCLTNDTTCEDYSTDILPKLVAPVIYLFILLIVGLLGNLIIVITYRNYGANVYMRIIWTVGVVDLMFCLLGIPFNLARMFRYYTFTSEIACQLLSSILDFGIMTSTHLLLLLTVFRFLQVCFPLRRQITVYNVPYFIAGCFVVSLCFGIAQFVVLQPLTETHLGNGVIGHSCTVAWKDSPAEWKGYNTFLLILFLVYTFIIFVLYALMGRKVYRQAKRRQSDLNVSSGNNGIDLSSRITKIAFTISAVFAVSYLPLFLGEVVDLKPDPKSNIVLFVFKTIVSRSYLINHAVNAIIYFIFDENFRIQMKRLIRMSSCNRSETSDNGNE